ncbi:MULTISPECIES: EamA family transporter [Photorhabdus]|uniref:Transporter n=2 Tax=Photorhabdus TaxID=29487 RepID=A0A0F7LQZ3_9GAMM|nr:MULTISPECIES: EamA family transporter [Photorhabdus]AKH64281.1 transporter [Photorhabdus thracensis]KER02904.1 EamA-like transporter family [Photorhabdus temperata subsp. temperata Meg1]MCC8422847.1 EamA family transporter [Photorhabdus thracensis]
MDLLSLGLVMVAAIMHAGWNLFVKKDEDKFLSLTVMAVTSSVLCAVLLLFMPGIDVSAWKILIISVPLHAGYRVCLSLGYKYGDMSQVYPIARGATPLLVALISVILLGVHLELTQIAGVVAIALGIMWLTFHAGFPKNNEGRAIGFALGTAAFIAVFTLLDSRGARLSGNPFSYVLWLFVLEGILMFVLAASVNRHRLLDYISRNGRTCMVNGVVMSVAHGLVILALSRSPAALVSALRETSVIFGVIFSAWILKEKIGPVKLTCTLVVMVGIFLAIFK